MRYREDIETRFTARHKACIEFSGDAKDRIVLDVGCWIGWYEKFMVKKGCKFIVGIDLYRNVLCKAKKSKYGGGIAEALSMVLLYPFKHLFGMEVPFKSFLEYLRNKEYQGKVFATLFIKAVKIDWLKD